jgi:hypothetical protein
LLNLLRTLASLSLVRKVDLGCSHCDRVDVFAVGAIHRVEIAHDALVVHVGRDVQLLLVELILRDALLLVNFHVGATTAVVAPLVECIIHDACSVLFATLVLVDVFQRDGNLLRLVASH